MRKVTLSPAAYGHVGDALQIYGDRFSGHYTILGRAIPFCNTLKTYMAEAPHFDWDEANIGHLARHGVTPEEAEQAYANEPVILDVAIRSGEERVLAAGRTDAGRPLQFVYTLRRTRIRIVTAHTAHKKVRDKL